MKSLLLTVLEFASRFAPADWRVFSALIVNAVRGADWDEGDSRWGELGEMAGTWLKDAMSSELASNATAATRARVVAELYATRELQRLNLLPGV